MHVFINSAKRSVTLILILLSYYSHQKDKRVKPGNLKKKAMLFWISGSNGEKRTSKFSLQRINISSNDSAIK
jgi:hypothetical protein